MNVIPAANAGKDFDGFVASVLAGAEPVVVSTPAGQSIVVMPLEEYESWQETHYLLRSPANAVHLRQSIAEAANHNFAQRELDEE
jgi:antitoxin YefM